MKYPLQWTLRPLGAEPGTVDFNVWLADIRTRFNAFYEEAGIVQGTLEVLTADSLAALIGQFGMARANWHQAMSLVECYLAEQAASEEYRLAFGTLQGIKPLLEKAEHQLDRVLCKIPQTQLQSWLETEALADVRDFVERRQQEAAIRLPDELADFAGELNVDGMHAWSRFYDQVSSAVRIPVMERGEIVEKSPGQIAFDSPDRSERENCFFASQKAWNNIADSCAAALNHLVGARLTQDKYARRKSHLTTAMLQNRVTERSVEAMWSAITDFKPVLVDYLRARQRLLGLEELCWYDLDASVAQHTEKVDYQSGCKIILEAFAAFHPPLYEFSRMALEQGWIEAEDRSGKRQGGFCIDFPNSQETRIFMTYRDTEDSLSTLAHELGHAYHGWVLRERPYVNQSYPMTLAETASTFAETVVAEQRLAASQTPEQQLATLDRLLGDAVTFLMNIHCRWIFDNEVHQKRHTHELSARELNRLMVQAQQQAYAQVLASTGYNPTFWISKLHFYFSDEPFYNFPYTYGYLLSQRLYQEARHDPQHFPARYDEFLLKTTAASALTAAHEAFGFDFESTTFWNEALQPIRDRAIQFQKMAQK